MFQTAWNFIKHGGKTVSQLTRSAVNGRTHTLISDKVGADYAKDLAIAGVPQSQIADAVNAQEGLLALYKKADTPVNTGDRIGATGLDAIRSHYYKLQNGTTKDNATFTFDDNKAFYDGSAVAAAAAAAIVGFKATQTGVSLITGDF